MLGQLPKQISPDALQLLLKYHWAGNIRELENAIERASVTSSDGVMQVENLPTELTYLPGPLVVGLPIDTNRTLSEVLRQVEKQYLDDVMKKTHGHVGRCAAISGRSRRSITSKLAEYNLDRTKFKES